MRNDERINFPFNANKIPDGWFLLGEGETVLQHDAYYSPFDGKWHNTRNFKKKGQSAGIVGQSHLKWYIRKNK